MRRAVIVAVMALCLVPVANANNWPEVRLDQAASQVAGKPVGVWCEENWSDWIEVGWSIFKQDFSYVNGLTFSSGNTVYLSPRQCETMHAIVAGGPEIVGQYYASSALLTLVHEAMHQRGLTNEGQADCAALAVIKDVGVNYFGYRTTQTETYLASVTRKVKVGKKVVRVTTQVQRTREVPNTTLAFMYDMAVRWHKAKPAEYQGNC